MSRFRSFTMTMVGALVLLLSISPLASINAAAEGVGDVRVFLRSCEGTATPFANPEKCRSTIEDDGFERVVLPPDVSLPLLDSSIDDGGAYNFKGLKADTEYYLVGFEPVSRDNVYVSGATWMENNGDWFAFKPVAGKTIEVTLTYFDGDYNGPKADGKTWFTPRDGNPDWVTGSSEVHVTLTVCPQGVDPRRDHYSCNQNVSADGTEYLKHLETGQKYYLKDQQRGSDGSYLFTNLPDGSYEHYGFEPVKTDRVWIDGVTSSELIVVEDGKAIVTFYYYYEN